MSNQLVKRNPVEGYKNVFPKTFIDAIKDRESGASLEEIIQGFNMYFLSYNGSKALTRCRVPSAIRKEGLWITYVLYDHTVVTEWYNSDLIDDESWGSDSNWRIASNALVGDISISTDGYWIINGATTNIKAQGETGITPLLRMGDNNKIQVTYNEGKNWEDISDYIVPKFRWIQGTGTTAGAIQISMDLGNTWNDLSNPITNNLRISKYIGINDSLPTSGIAEGTIYMKGPYYDENDTNNDNPIYRMWVYAWKGNTLAWQDNGEFTSISAGVVQERGTSTTQVMSQDAVTRELTELESKTEDLNIKVFRDKFERLFGFVTKNGTISSSDIWSHTPLIRIDSIFSGDQIKVLNTGNYEELVCDVVFFDKDKKAIGYFNLSENKTIHIKSLVEGTYYVVFNQQSSLPDIIIEDASLGYINMEKAIYANKLNYYNGYYKEYYRIDTSWSCTPYLLISDILIDDKIVIEGNIASYEEAGVKSCNFLDISMQNIGGLNPSKGDDGRYIISKEDIPLNAAYVVFNTAATHTMNLPYWNRINDRINAAHTNIQEGEAHRESVDVLICGKDISSSKGFYGNNSVILSDNWKHSNKLFVNDIIGEVIHIDNTTTYSEGGVILVHSVVACDKNGIVLHKYASDNGSLSIHKSEIEDSEYIILNTLSSKPNFRISTNGNFPALSEYANKDRTLVYQGSSSTDRIVFKPIRIKKGDIIRTSYGLGKEPTKDFTIQLCNDKALSDSKSQGIKPTNVGENVFVADSDYNGMRFWIHMEDGVVLSAKVNQRITQNLHTKGEIYVAASNSTIEDKELADYICDGANDEFEIQCAIDSITPKGKVILLGGTYYIDSIPQNNGVYCAIAARDYGAWDERQDITISGVGHRAPEGNTIIVVRESAFRDVPNNIEPSIIGSEQLSARFCGMNVNDLRIVFESNQHKCTAINLEYFGHGICSNVVMVGGSDTIMPVEGFVGLRCFHGFSTGYSSMLINVSCTNGFYEAFQMGGEHVVAIELHALKNYCNYTFGHYSGGNYGAFSHDITMINCCDEAALQLPIFYECGAISTNETTEQKLNTRQNIRLLDFNLEVGNSHIENKPHPLRRAKEVNPGQFCGYINFTSGGDGKNDTALQFWENDGSGKNFKTENSTHALGGSTAERETYYAQYMQHYFDTDLNKELVCIDVATQKWVDVMGNIVA